MRMRTRERYMGKTKIRAMVKSERKDFGINLKNLKNKDIPVMKPISIKKDYIYIILNKKFKTCKISFGKNHHKKLHELQNGDTECLKLYLVFEGTEDIKKRLSHKYRRYSLNGEWFKFEGDLRENLSKMKKENKFKTFL